MYSLSEARRALSAVDLQEGLDVPEVESRLLQGLRLHETGQRILAFYLVEMAERRLHLESGHSSTAGYAEARLGLDRRRVAELVSVGRKLLELRAIDRAFCEQRIGWTKLLHVVRVACPEHEEAWLARALELTTRDLALEVRLSEPGERPRGPGERKGLPEIRFRMSCSLPALTHRKIDLAKRKLAAELGRPVDDAEYLDVVSELFLNLEEDGTVEGRTRVSSSIYRIVLRPDVHASEDDASEDDVSEDDVSEDMSASVNRPRRLLLDTEEGPIPIDARDLCCDAETVDCCGSDSDGVKTPDVETDDVKTHDIKTHDIKTHDIKTPAKLRKKVLDRDGNQCRCCGGRWRLMVHHIRFLSEGGRTQAYNLITICALCHSLVHEGLLVLDGERQEDVRFQAVRFQDKAGNALHEPGTGVDPTHLIPLTQIVPKEPPCNPVTLNTVTLNTVPEVVDGSWWRRHSHLIHFRSGKGLEFRTGEAASEEHVQASPTECDVNLANGDAPQTNAFEKGAFEGDAFKNEVFEGLVGLDALLRRLRTAANGSRRRGRSYPHTLFVGPPGTGKTTLARGVAAAFGARLHATSGPLVEDPHALLRLLASLEKGDILFIDEIHAVPRAVLEVLYEAMCSTRRCVPRGAGGHVDLTLHAGVLARTVRLDLPAFTLLAATTEEGDLPTPLRSRFGRREALGFYTNEDLAAIAAAQAADEGAPLEPEAASLLAAHARGTPRETPRLVDCILDETAVPPTKCVPPTRLGLPATFDEGEMLDTGRALDEGAVRDALERLGYDHEGLDPTEQRYVAVLRESAVPIPLRRLARLLGASARTLVEHVEPYLFRRNFVRMTAQGRQAVPVHHSCPSLVAVRV